MKDTKEKSSSLEKDLFEGLQLPNEATRPIKSSVKKVVVKPHFTDEEMAKKEFNDRVKESKKKAIEENIKLASASGNKLTQTIDEDGNLIGVNNIDFSDREIVDPDTPPPAK